ncbi:MAG: hypothetical protein AAF389_14815 [Gemmatimonadota bacterium]
MSELGYATLGEFEGVGNMRGSWPEDGVRDASGVFRTKDMAAYDALLTAESASYAGPAEMNGRTVRVRGNVNVTSCRLEGDECVVELRLAGGGLVPEPDGA